MTDEFDNSFIPTDSEETTYTDVAEDASLADIAAQNAPTVEDDNYPRYAMSALLPICLFRQNGNNSFGDFNKKGPDGKNIVNHNYFPAFQLIPLFGGSFPIPYEHHPTESQEPVTPAPFNYNAHQTERTGYDRLTRSPRQCADVFLNETRGSGGQIFQSLIGYHVSDPDRGFNAARTLLKIVFPVHDRDIFPVEMRKKGGVPFKGPFLDQLLEYVIDNAVDAVSAANLSPADEAVGMKLALEVRKVLQTGMKLANIFVDETEAEIRDPEGRKQTYDQPNLDVDDAPVSTDLYCLAHLNRTEADLKQIEAAKHIGAESAVGITEAVKSIDRLAQSMAASNVPQTVPANVMTIEEVKALLDAQEARFDEKLKAAAAGAGAETGTETIAAADTDDDEPVFDPVMDA